MKIIFVFIGLFILLLSSLTFVDEKKSTTTEITVSYCEKNPELSVYENTKITEEQILKDSLFKSNYKS